MQQQIIPLIVLKLNLYLIGIFKLHTLFTFFVNINVVGN